MDTELQQLFERILDESLTPEQKQLLATINAMKSDNQ